MKPILDSIGWWLGPSLAAICWTADLGLEPSAQKLAGIMIWVVLWWIFETLPLAVTGFFGVTLAIVLGVADAKTALAPYAHKLVFLFLGGFVLAKAMSVHGLDRRIALHILSRPIVQGSPKRIILALLGISAFFSMWISNTATTAMMLPISLGVLKMLFPNEVRSSLRNEFPSGNILIAIAYASSIAGIATPIGSTPNIILMGILDEQLGIRLTFLEWMLYGLPVAIFVLLALVIYTFRFLKNIEMPEKIDLSNIENEYLKLGSLSTGEKNTVIAFLTAVSIWVVPSMITIIIGKEHEFSQLLLDRFPEVIGALAGVIILFALRLEPKKPTLSWKQAMDIDWGSLLLFGGGLSLGAMMFETGLAQVVGEKMVSITGGSFYFFLFISIAFAIFFTETTSNTATASMMIPLVIAVSHKMGHEAFIPTFAVALACSLAFMMPVSTPPNAIVFGSGRIELRQMMRKGIWMNLMSLLILFLFSIAYKSL